MAITLQRCYANITDYCLTDMWLWTENIDLNNLAAVLLVEALEFSIEDNLPLDIQFKSRIIGNQCLKGVRKVICDTIMVHRGHSRHFSKLSYWYCHYSTQFHDLFAQNSMFLATLFGYKAFTVCDVYYPMYFFVFYFIISACISVSHLLTLASMNHIISHI